MLRLWNAMNAGMSRADSGASYLRPCLIESDFSSRRAIKHRVLLLLHVGRQASGCSSVHAPRAPSIRLFQPLYSRRIPNRTYTCIFSSSSWPVKRFCTIIFAEFCQRQEHKQSHQNQISQSPSRPRTVRA